MVPVNVYAYAVLSTPQILGFTSGYILIFLRGTPQNLTRLHAYASGSPDDPCKLTIYITLFIILHYILFYIIILYYIIVFFIVFYSSTLYIIYCIIFNIMFINQCNLNIYIFAVYIYMSVNLHI